MLIGIDASRANRLQRSGVEWYAYRLIKNLYKIDFENQFFLYTEKKLVDDLKPSGSNFQEKVLKWPFPRFWTMGRMSLEMVLNKPDVLFVPSHNFPFFGGKKNVITIHDVGFARYPETYLHQDLISLKQGIKKAIKMADKIIAISHFTKEDLVRTYNVEPERINVIYPGCNHNRWLPAPQQVIKDYLERKNIEVPYIICLGRITLKKNVIGLIKIYNRFREKIGSPFNLLLVGSDNHPFQNEINEEIKNSPYSSEIKKMGWLPVNEVPILLSGAHAMVFPSIYEGFGLPVIEAMACGCPVISSMAGALPEIVGQAGILIPTHDVEGFANKMVEIVEDQNLRRDLINKGLERSKQFSWEKCARETLEVLESLT